MRRLLLAALLLLMWPGSARAEWREASTRHFVIYSEGTEAELRATAEELERFDRTLRYKLRRPDPDRSPATRLTIFILRHQDQLAGFLGSDRIAGRYFPRYSGSLAVTHRGVGQRDRDSMLDPRTTLLHEYTHHFLYNNFAFGAPLWFSEGYPEFWSTTRSNENGSVDYGRPGAHRSLELSQLPNLHVARLLTVRFPVRDGETISATYARGWVLAHYLTFEPAREGQLNAYLRALGEGRTAEDAAKVFGDLNQLERELQGYLGRNRYRYGTISAEQVRPGPVTIRRLRPGEEAIMTVRMRTKRGVDEREAQTLVAEARRAAAPYPDDPLVQVVLAEVEYDARNFAQAEAAANRALAADPRNVDAHLFKARAIAGRLTAAAAPAGTAPAGTPPASAGATPAPRPQPSPAEWREVQRLIAAANRIDPDDPEPLVAFYDSFEGAGMQPTANAVEGLLDAQALAPEDRGLRIRAGRQLLALGNAAGARAMLAPVTGDAHSGALGPAVAEILAGLTDRNTAEAAAKLDAALRQPEGPRRPRR
jgi:tetratricopeptide (TPR) repeat protein